MGCRKCGDEYLLFYFRNNNIAQALNQEEETTTTATTTTIFPRIHRDPGGRYQQSLHLK
jgi:hypothetical protein